ncbi:LytR/AlgR family response regulator transcription factor [Pseudoalteromonas phenolica]|uniref:Alginate biosynthesis regulatory protein n=1 Tax=Pseudoalteromonas phenolica TaxID=161398 RepID=A0A0S2JZC1_9GAMM|nr:LytTR family DNA-binding domain-containing protein [Pseudoalteromonas phenolica]ALO41377.1 Alginate biosynthesis regulatory protein [Pseudoalteromonas phenolica]MBE0354079.1 two-component system, LytT family, response regulator AlgR [Pseudoalteromonas phenolica O-BC30]
MKYIIADDEPLARARIMRLLKAWPHYECVAEVSSGDDVESAIIENPVQLLFLDINMPGLDGIKTAEMLNQKYRDLKIIFITAHSEFALEAFNVFAAGFLVKPVSQSDLFSLLERLFKPRIQYQVGAQIRWVDVDEVIVAKAEDKLTQIYFQGGEATIDLSLKKLLNLYPDHFVQIHRNTLVKAKSIVQLEHTHSGILVSLANYPEKLAVSRRAYSSIKNHL